MNYGHLCLRLAAWSVLAAHTEKVCADEWVQISVEHRFGVAALHAGAHVLDHAIGRQHVVADLRAERVVGFARLDLVALGLLLAKAQFLEARLHHLPRPAAVLLLPALVLLT